MMLQLLWSKCLCIPDTNVEPHPHLKVPQGGVFEEVIVTRADPAWMRLIPREKRPRGACSPLPHEDMARLLFR